MWMHVWRVLVSALQQRWDQGTKRWSLYQKVPDRIYKTIYSNHQIFLLIVWKYCPMFAVEINCHLNKDSNQGTQIGLPFFMSWSQGQSQGQNVLDETKSGPSLGPCPWSTWTLTRTWCPCMCPCSIPERGQIAERPVNAESSTSTTAKKLVLNLQTDWKNSLKYPYGPLGTKRTGPTAQMCTLHPCLTI